MVSLRLSSKIVQGLMLCVLPLRAGVGWAWALHPTCTASPATVTPARGGALNRVQRGLPEAEQWPGVLVCQDGVWWCQNWPWVS